MIEDICQQFVKYRDTNSNLSVLKWKENNRILSEPEIYVQKYR